MRIKTINVYKNVDFAKLFLLSEYPSLDANKKLIRGLQLRPQFVNERLCFVAILTHVPVAVSRDYTTDSNRLKFI